MNKYKISGNNVLCLNAVLSTAAVTGFPGGCRFPNG
jgi:hypothetical protein